MAVLSGFEYDIFLSYRHNDNRSGWVTEFVNALKEELASTIKEPLTIYFDKNPHDGLLETHNVDKSLEGKLKCLIFIPIISQTYCDTKSFAWQHEFVAFNKLASGNFPSPEGEGGRRPDEGFGRDIKLSNGNVASRILPIKIHDLDADDKSLLESEMGGVLRAIEFIFKSSGVNRPLTSSDKREENSSKTFYRDQINKVANAIKEIIQGLKKPSTIQVVPSTSSTITSSKIEKSIAVLPFTNMSSDPEQEYFSDGISEEIINMLAQVSGLKVAGRTSSFSFKGKNQDLRLIGEQLSVTHILEGSVRKAGRKLRITAQLIKASDGYHLYSEKFDRELHDIFEVQDEISLAILNAIKIKLFPKEKDAVVKKYTENVAAYELYLQGRYHVNKYNGTEAFLKGIKYYEEAIKQAPDYALAYEGIAYCYMELYMDNLLPHEQCKPQLLQAVKRSMELDDTIAETNLALANLKMFVEWDFKGVSDLYQKALAINSNSPEVHRFYAFYLLFTKDFDNALKHASVSYDLDPFSVAGNWEIAWIFLWSGQPEKGMEMGKKLMVMEPSFFGGHLIVGCILIYQKKFDEAKPLLEMAVKLYPIFMTLRCLAIVNWKLGNKQKCRDLIAEMEELGKTTAISNRDMGQIYAIMGQFDVATDYFQKAFENREAMMLFTKDDMMMMDETIFVSQISEIIEKVEAIKRNH